MTTSAPAAAVTSSDGHPAPQGPEPILQLAAGFMAAKHLFAASELGLFEALAGSPATIDALAARTGLTRRAARISADAMVALGLLERDSGTYSNSDTAATFLAGATPADLRPLLRFWDKISYPSWAGFAGALATGPSQEITKLDDALQQVASRGIEAMLTGPAAALTATVDFPARQRLLDVGGGTGSWSIAIARAHPHMKATVFELPAVAAVAHVRITEAGLGSRIDVVDGDALGGALPTGYDTCLLANIIHYYSPAENQTLLRHARAATTPRGCLLLVDFWTDPTHSQPLMAALMAGEFAAHLRNGDVYSVSEAREWLEPTGWRFAGHQPLAGPISLITAEAV